MIVRQQNEHYSADCRTKASRCRNRCPSRLPEDCESSEVADYSHGCAYDAAEGVSDGDAEDSVDGD